MIRADYKDRADAVKILSDSFADNKSVNYIIKQDSKKDQRIIKLMEYSFDVCYLFGDVFFSENKKACALLLYPDKKKTTIKSILLDLKLIFSCIGVENIKKALTRESKIKKIQPKEIMYYLWFIGVDPTDQNSGIGSKLINEIILDSGNKKRPVFLETSTLKNLPWYKKFGFEIYGQLDLGYKLFFLKRE